MDMRKLHTELEEAIDQLRAVETLIMNSTHLSLLDGFPIVDKLGKAKAKICGVAKVLREESSNAQ